MKRFSRQLPLAVLAALISHFLIQATFAATIGGTGQLTDLRYVTVVSAIFGSIAFGLVQMKRPFSIGLTLGSVLFLFVQILRFRLADGLSVQSICSDLLFDFGYFVLPSALMVGYQRWALRSDMSVS